MSKSISIIIFTQKSDKIEPLYFMFQNFYRINFEKLFLCKKYLKYKNISSNYKLFIYKVIHNNLRKLLIHLKNKLS